jgi:UDP-N-acetylmuramoyl-tripeptide--D-alanyl-D-alanine ligase
MTSVGGKRMTIYGVHNIYNALFAIAIGDLLGFPPEEISTGLRQYNKPVMRTVTTKLNNNITGMEDVVNYLITRFGEL